MSRAVRCIRCQHDSKYKERPNRVCPGCSGKFAFEPREGDRLTDAAFQRAIDMVSGIGMVRWGVEHLYYQLVRRLAPSPTARALGRCVPAGGALVALTATGTLPAVLLVPGALGIAALWARYRKRPPFAERALELDDFNRMWKRWKEAHGVPPTCIVRRPVSPAPYRPPEPDIADYSFDRAVICDRARTVDLLLANNFHFENNCAVLSLNGYPHGSFELVRSMLKRNPRLEVFALHDATVDGCTMIRKLVSDPAWFKGHAQVTDVGLRPRHADPFRGLYLPPQKRQPRAAGVTLDEEPWLSEYSLELAAIRPDQVLKRLFRAINRQADGAKAAASDGTIAGDTHGDVWYDGGSVRFDDSSFATGGGDGDVGTADASSDSFG